MMNSNPKLDLHPDAERLNAFAEQALPERERGEIVAHLAKCRRCREVVYLAQEATAEMEPELHLVAAAAAVPVSVAPRERWFRSWRVAWIPVGALAVGLSVAYIVHVRHEEIVAEQAKAASEAAARNIEMASTPQAPPIGMQAAAAPVAAPATPTAKGLKPPLLNTTSRQIAVVAAPPPAREANAVASASGIGAGSQAGVSGGEYPAVDTAAEYKPEAVSAEKRQEQAVATKVLRARGLEAGKSSQASAGEPRKINQVHGVVAAAEPLAQLEVAPATAGGAETSGRFKTGGVSALYRMKMAVLPSGLNAVSTAMTSSDMLAVDGAGGVFLSEDAGVHWMSVAKQWSGRAVAVRLQPRGETDAGAANSSVGVFEISNDQGLVWVSTDGKIWKAK